MIASKKNLTTLKLPAYINAKHIDQIEMNWLTQYWFILDRTNHLLYKCLPKLSHCTVFADHQILSHPLTFKLDQKWLFISREGDRSKSIVQTLSPAILKIRINKNINVKVIVKKAIIEPRHLTLDIVKQKLFWIDVKLGF